MRVYIFDWSQLSSIVGQLCYSIFKNLSLTNIMKYCYIDFLEDIDYSNKTIVGGSIIEYSYERCSLLNSSFKKFLFKKSYLGCCHLENLEIYKTVILRCDFNSTSFCNIKMVDSACYSSEFNGFSFSYLNLDGCCFYTTVFENCSFKKNSYSSDRIKQLFNENTFINCTIVN